MIVAGVGCRRGTPADGVEAALNAACRQAGIALTSVTSLATGVIKEDEPGILELAARLNLPLHIVGDDDLRAAESRTRTVSRHSLAKTVSPSLSEAAALAVAGERSALLVARVIAEGATCALARPEQSP
ncbi:MAG TPA: cobalamin biosynthesis protein [Pseudorhizobium sp.]|nr:cobalamin biosynthesis protein [Pseudorhizobium sp.]